MAVAAETASFRKLLVPTTPNSLRFCEFNTFMNRDNAGKLAAELKTPESEQIQRVAATIQVCTCTVISAACMLSVLPRFSISTLLQRLGLLQPASDAETRDGHVQLMDCDVIALMEFDYSDNPQQYEDFKNNYLAVPQTQWGSKTAIRLPCAPLFL